MVVFSSSPPIYFHSRSPTFNPLRRLKFSSLDSMCRSTDFDRFHDYGDRLLNRKAFFFQFSALLSENPPPEFLTLKFLPPILGELETRSVSPPFLTLYPLAFPSGKNSSVVFCSREAVRVGEGDRFEGYMRQEKVMEGIIVKEEDHLDGRLGCEVEVCMEIDGHVALLEDKPSALLGKKKKQKKSRGFHRLEEIPEEREMGNESDGLDCCDGDLGCGNDGGDLEKEFDLEFEMERVRWAVDLGIWVTCLGVGYLISKSPFALRKRRFL